MPSYTYIELPRGHYGVWRTRWELEIHRQTFEQALRETLDTYRDTLIALAKN